MRSALLQQCRLVPACALARAGMEILSKSGAHLSYGDVRLGMGREAAKQFLRENADISGNLENEIRNPPGENGEADADSKDGADGQDGD